MELLHSLRVMYEKRNIASIVWDSDSAQGFLQLSPQLSPQSNKPQSLLTQFQSTLPSLHQSPRIVAANEILCVGPLGRHLCLADSYFSLADGIMLICTARCYVDTYYQL